MLLENFVIHVVVICDSPASSTCIEVEIEHHAARPKRYRSPYNL